MVCRIYTPSYRFSPRGRYRVTDRIGGGGYGEIFRCTDAQSHLHVRGGRGLACKRIPWKIEKKRTGPVYERSMDVLENEIRMMEFLTRSYPRGHPNLVGMEDCSEVDSEKPFLVMEFCEGGDLSSLIEKSGGKLVEAMARKVMLSLMTAIDACHRQGVMQGDIKPENAVLMEEISTSKDAHVDVIKLKLCDFGLSRHLKGGETCSRVVGTIPYMAPEVFRGRLGLESDIWAAGVTLHFMLSGQFPFGGETHQEVCEQQMQSENWAHFFTTSAQWESVSGEAKDLIRNMLSFHTWERTSVKDFFQHPWVTGQAPAPRFPRRYLPLSIPPADLLGCTIAAL